MSHEEKRQAVKDRERQNVKMMQEHLLEPILEIGCNRGDLLTALYEADYHDVTGLDLMPAQHIKAVQGSSASMPFKEASFNTVILSHTYAHIRPEDMLSTLQEIRRVSRPGGRIIIIGSDIVSTQAWTCPRCGHDFRYTHRRYDEAYVKARFTQYAHVQTKEFIPALFWTAFPFLELIAPVIKPFIKTRNRMVVFSR